MLGPAKVAREPNYEIRKWKTFNFGAYKWKPGQRAFVVLVDLQASTPKYYIREADYSGPRWRKGKFKECANESGITVTVPEKNPGYGIGNWHLSTMTRVETWDELIKKFRR